MLILADVVGAEVPLERSGSIDGVDEEMSFPVWAPINYRSGLSLIDRKADNDR